jgi:hypothetical protein
MQLGAHSLAENHSCHHTFSFVSKRGGYFYLFGLSSSKSEIGPQRPCNLYWERQKSEHEETGERIWT